MSGDKRYAKKLKLSMLKYLRAKEMWRLSSDPKFAELNLKDNTATEHFETMHDLAVAAAMNFNEARVREELHPHFKSEWFNRRLLSFLSHKAAYTYRSTQKAVELCDSVELALDMITKDHDDRKIKVPVTKDSREEE